MKTRRESFDLIIKDRVKKYAPEIVKKIQEESYGIDFRTTPVLIPVKLGGAPYIFFNDVTPNGDFIKKLTYEEYNVLVNIFPEELFSEYHRSFLGFKFGYETHMLFPKALFDELSTVKEIDIHNLILEYK